MIKAKIIFWGTSDFAVPALEALVKKSYEVTVITTPDKPAGRKRIFTSSPVKIAAQKLGLKVLQPQKLKGHSEFIASLLGLGAISGVVASYGKIIPKEIIALFPCGLLNIHPSLLPKYRGPSPIQTAILNGEKETGVTILLVDEQLDHGPLLVSRKWRIGNEIRYEDLRDKLAREGAKLITEVLPAYLTEKIKPLPQKHHQATFTSMIRKDDGRVNWQKEVGEIFNQFRAFHLWPGLWTTWQGKILKITACRIGSRSPFQPFPAGTVFERKGVIAVSCRVGSLEIVRVHGAGGKDMRVKDFVAGHKNLLGSQLS